MSTQSPKLCTQCGAPLPQTGKCHYCGTIFAVTEQEHEPTIPTLPSKYVPAVFTPEPEQLTRDKTESVNVQPYMTLYVITIIIALVFVALALVVHFWLFFIIAIFFSTIAAKLAKKSTKTIPKEKVDT